jgi:hypothetical protein
MAGTLSVYHGSMRPIKVKPKKEKKNPLLKTNQKKQKKRNIQGKYKVLMIWGSHKKNSNNETTKSIFHHFFPNLPVHTNVIVPKF